MTPTHKDGLAAAKRVMRDIEAGMFAAVNDTLLMHCYQLSLELRRIPEGERMGIALRIARDIVKNTRESMD